MLRHWPVLRYTSAARRGSRPRVNRGNPCLSTSTSATAAATPGGHAEAHDAPLKKCPQCGKSQLQRLMSAPVFRLKGGGWYETDFKSDQDAKRNLADRPEAPAAKDETKATTEAQSKDAAAPDARQGQGRRSPISRPRRRRRAKSRSARARTQDDILASWSARRRANRPKPKAPAKRPARAGAKRTAAKPARRR